MDKNNRWMYENDHLKKANLRVTHDCSGKPCYRLVGEEWNKNRKRWEEPLLVQHYDYNYLLQQQPYLVACGYWY